MTVVVVGVDGSPGATGALRWAAEEARLRGTTLRAVLAWSYLDQPGEEFDPRFGEEQARGVLDKALEAAFDGSPPVEIEPVVVCDLPARALLEAAKDAALLVVGSRGLGGFKGLLLGSVSHQVAQHASCPVAVIPGGERASAK